MPRNTALPLLNREILNWALQVALILGLLFSPMPAADDSELNRFTAHPYGRIRITAVNSLNRQDVRRLEADRAIEQTLEGGNTHHYQVTVAAGQCLRIVVDQRGIDLIVSVKDQIGEKILDVDSPNGLYGPEIVEIVTDNTGIYQVDVSALESKAALGKYEIKIDKVGKATPVDRSRFNAQRIIFDARVLNRRGTKEDLNKAIEKYKEAVPHLRLAGDSRGEGQVFEMVGEIYYSFSEYRESISYVDQAVKIYSAAGLSGDEARALGTLASCYLSMSQWQKSIDIYQEALVLSKKTGNRRSEAFILSNLASAYSEWGEYQRAIEFSQKALLLRREVNDRRGEGRTLVQMGDIYRDISDNQRALDYFNQAVPILREQKDLQWEGYVLEDIGTVYEALGDYENAVENYTLTLSIMRSIGDRRIEASMYEHIGGVYLKRAEFQKALDSLNRGLLIYKSVGFLVGEVDSLNKIGQVHQQLHDYQKALSFFNQALSLSREIKNSNRTATSTFNLGVLYTDLGEPQKSSEYLRRALATQNGLSPQSEASVLYELAYAQIRLDNINEARVLLESALRILDSIRSSVMTRELRISYLASKWDYYNLYIDVMMQLHKQSASPELMAIAFQTSEHVRARVLQELLTEARIDIRRGVDSELVTQEQSLQQMLGAKGEVLMKLRMSSNRGEEEVSVEKEINGLKTELRQIQTEIRQKSPSYAALTQSETLNLKEIQQQILGPDTILLEYSLGAERSYLWLVTQTSIDAFELPKRSTIEDAAQQVYDVLTARTRCKPGKDREAVPLTQAVQLEARYPQIAAKLSEMVLRPATAQLGNKRLLIVSEGVLQSIPFGALPLPTLGNRTAQPWTPLMAEHEVINLPSASTLAVLRHELAGRKAAPKTLAAIANPILDAASLARFNASLNINTLATAADSPLRNFGVACAGMGVPALPFSKREAEAIAALTAPNDRQLMVGLDASRAKILGADLTQYRIIHFATHGLLNSRHPDLSGLVLSLVDEKGMEQNGILQLHEIYNLKLNADLVVLSACETALGTEIRGEGRIGMTRGFMYAGAARVLASLWKVDDEATRDLMKLFYEKLLREKMRPAAALRAAQLEMRRQKRWQSPYFWGAFTLQGEYL